MEKITLYTPLDSVSCHAWNADRTQLAVCPNTHELHIYRTRDWTRLHTLSQHDLVISAVDWSATTNKIVTCSHDR
jgi:actin related protein 2/3 complex subunit 1A/1B